ncbi:MAG TPA: serine hydrolase domain-containing protein, partial [Cyclobacteriaceae bacterium]|nr:serine hydrolase domain-containing protein [Cyclobacteriaceae bacterium]
MRILTLILIQLATAGLLHAQSRSIEQAIDQYLDPYVKSNNFAGTIYVAKSGKVLYEKSFGIAIIEWSVPNTNETKYHLASVSKPFTSTSILLLEQQGKLGLTDLVSKYLPEFKDGNKITIHNLLSHTSGIVNINDFPEYDSWSLSSMTLDSIISKFQKRPLLFEPGTKYSYSNS